MVYRVWAQPLEGERFCFKHKTFHSQQQVIDYMKAWAERKGPADFAWVPLPGEVVSKEESRQSAPVYHFYTTAATPWFEQLLQPRSLLERLAAMAEPVGLAGEFYIARLERPDAIRRLTSKVYAGPGFLGADAVASSFWQFLPRAGEIIKYQLYVMRG